MLAISAGTAAVGYIILDANGVLGKKEEQQNTSDLVKREVVQHPKVEIEKVTIPDVVEKPREAIAALPLPTNLPQVPVVQLPESIDLPPRESLEVVELFDLQDEAKFTVSSLDHRLELVGNLLVLNKGDEENERIAGMTIRANKLVFKWLPEATGAGVSAVRNGLLQVEQGSGTSFVALREPVIVSRTSLDLKRPVSRILCECEDPPLVKDIVLTLTVDSTLPQFTTTGSKLVDMRQGDECVLWYKYTYNDDQVTRDQLLRKIGPNHYIKEAVDFGLGTKVMIKRRGNVLAAELYSRYRLPSGDEGSLTLSNGRKKRNKIELLVQSSINASRSIGNLRSAANQLQKDLSKWQGMNVNRNVNGMSLPMSDLAMKKQAGIASTTKALKNTRGNIAKAERLIENRLSYEIELLGLNRISRMAQDLILSRGFGFRFFFVLEGREIDLVVSAP